VEEGKARPGRRELCREGCPRTRLRRAPVIEDVPEPAIEGPLDVVVEVGGAGLCRTDLHVIEGQWAEKTGVSLPYTLGHENAGWVREVGSAVTNVAPGDAVILHPVVSCGLCRACRDGNDSHCAEPRFPGLDCDGGMAEFLRTSARAVVKLDAGLRPAEVAALALAKQLGAHDTVHAVTDPVAAVLDLTDGQGAHVVIDFVGEKGTERQSLEMLRRAGSYYVVGYGGTVEVPTIDVIFSEINVVGNLVGTYNDLVELMALSAQGQVRLRTQTYPLDAVNDAIADLDGGRLQGRGILLPR
jgi:NAD+-dependent secondary alcohol dehydrogenase Adh1